MSGWDTYCRTWTSTALGRRRPIPRAGKVALIKSVNSPAVVIDGQKAALDSTVVALKRTVYCEWHLCILMTAKTRVSSHLSPTNPASSM